MLVADKLKEHGICVYLLYMWQIEDLVRAYGFDEEKMEKEYVSRFPESERVGEMRWLRSIIGMMREEGCAEKGHLQMNNNTLYSLEDLHYKLLSSGGHPAYSAAYYKALPHLAHIRSHGNQDKHEIEVGLEALYCITLLRMKKQKVDKETHRAVKLITVMLQALSDAYQKEKQRRQEQ